MESTNISSIFADEKSFVIPLFRARGPSSDLVEEEEEDPGSLTTHFSWTRVLPKKNPNSQFGRFSAMFMRSGVFGIRSGFSGHCHGRKVTITSQAKIGFEGAGDFKLFNLDKLAIPDLL